MNALAPIIAWPELLEDERGLALWDAVEIARAVGGVAMGQFQVSRCAIAGKGIFTDLADFITPAS